MDIEEILGMDAVAFQFGFFAEQVRNCTCTDHVSGAGTRPDFTAELLPQQLPAVPTAKPEQPCWGLGGLSALYLPAKATYSTNWCILEQCHSLLA